MRVLIDGKLYDSTKTPMLLIFDDNEQDIFGLKRFVSAPEDTTVEERQKLIETEVEESE